MFKITGELEGRRVEVTWDAGRLDPWWLQVEAETEVKLIRSAGVQEVVVALQAVPVDLKNDLFAYWLLQRLLRRVEVVDGSLASLLSAGDVVI